MLRPHDTASERTLPRALVDPEVLVLLIPVLLKLFLHLLFVNGYGIHGDELYYLACSNHLDWGYVDQPSLSILLLHLERISFGDVAISLRLLPALAGSVTILLTGLLARRMGSGLFGQFLAGMCVLVAPAFLALNHYFSMNAFDLLFWTLAVYLLVRIVDDGTPAHWVWFGVVMGLGFENKIGVLFLGFAVVVGLLLTNQRRLLFNRWAWVAALAAVLLMIPYVLWQFGHDWATLEWMHNARTQKMVALSPAAFLREQLLLIGPLNVLVWGPGVVALLFTRSLERYRFIGWMYLVLLVLLIAQGAKAYYLAPIYPSLLAAGSLAIERMLTRPVFRISFVALLIAAGTAFAPLGMPLLPPETFLHYQDILGSRPNLGEKWAEGKMPSFFANFFGWKELAATVDTVYRSLPPQDRAQCGIYGRNYMQAGAIDFYGATLGLPPAIAGHNNYWLWGPRGYSGEVMIVLDGSVEELRKTFDEVTEVARFRHEYMQPMQSNIPIFVVRRIKYPLSEIWPKVQSYI